MPLFSKKASKPGDFHYNKFEGTELDEFSRDWRERCVRTDRCVLLEDKESLKGSGGGYTVLVTALRSVLRKPAPAAIACTCCCISYTVRS
jgi:hypothetical protein